MRDHAMSKKDRIASRIKDARIAAGLSQARVALMLGLHRPAISEIEAGRRSVSAEELAKLSEFLDVEITWLMGETEEELNPNSNHLELAARELSKLKPEDLDRLMKILASMRGGSSKQ
jgi:transcriptional regulator with XRE-family HTH domain